jgi:hypothetical protein
LGRRKNKQRDMGRAFRAAAKRCAERGLHPPGYQSNCGHLGKRFCENGFFNTLPKKPNAAKPCCEPDPDFSFKEQIREI